MFSFDFEPIPYAGRYLFEEALKAVFDDCVSDDSCSEAKPVRC